MIPPRRHFRRVGWAGSFATLLSIVAAAEALGECAPVLAGNDTTGWNSARGTYLGRALGQTFYASDTLIARITVWRYPNNLTYSPTRLFVTMVDTINYDPPRPITQNIIQNGPAVLVPNSDPPGLPIRLDFILDPPLDLPHPGTYAFFLQREGCDAGETIIIAREPSTSYPHGTHWLTGRTAFLPCFLRDVDGSEDLDLCFEMEFCREEATPVHEESWGRLKVIYR